MLGVLDAVDLHMVVFRFGCVGALFRVLGCVGLLGIDLSGSWCPGIRCF